MIKRSLKYKSDTIEVSEERAEIIGFADLCHPLCRRRRHYLSSLILISCLVCRLWLATVNALCPSDSPVAHLTPQLYTDEDIMKDPLTVLRCDRRVFR